MTSNNNRKTPLTLLVMAQQVRTGRRYLRAFVSGFFVAVPVSLTVFDRFACVARVEGASMQPSLNPEAGPGDVVLLNRWSVRNHQVQRGDIVSVLGCKCWKQHSSVSKAVNETKETSIQPVKVQ
ncbi:Mitochondrial inner membrane protease subunit 2 [Takifugu flavidus]|uniref:Mitochondrial inner membrane protease subunit 2 n=1 Tax=Takifugu flavidus TaxID=433684 RepID=A0A5C6P6Z4_9TELE|nr:Mitochondrial inner membrane protease subunit 2 [Takifugu flavidus]